MSGAAPTRDRSVRAGRAPGVDERGGGPDRGRERDCADAEPAKRLQSEEPDERGEEDEMERGSRTSAQEAGERLEAEQEERREDDDAYGEENDVPAARAADREELDVSGEQVEERLGDCERRETGEVERRPAERSGWVRRGGVAR